VLKADFDRYAARWNLILKEQIVPASTEKALRVLHATPDANRGKLALAIMQGLHTGMVDIEDTEVLKEMAIGLVPEAEVDKAVADDSLDAGELQRTTEELANHLGALSLPAFWVPDASLKVDTRGVGFADGGQVHMGQDRLHVS